MQEELVSIIVPVYNVEKYLPACLNSIINQTYKNLEIIVVNDGSKDNSLSIIEEFAKIDRRIVVINKTNGGLSSARNAGLDASHGSQISFIDSDDYVSTDFIETLYNDKKLTNADLSMVDFEKVYEGKKFSFKNKKVKLSFSKDKDGVKNLLGGKLYNIITCNKLYSRDLLDSQRFDETIFGGEDQSFNYFYMKKCKLIVFNKNKKYAYLQRKGSIVNSSFNPKKITVFIGINKMLEDSKNDPELLPYVKSWLCLISIETAYFVWRSKYKDKDLISSILKNIKENKKYLKDCKKILWHRRKFIGLAYILFRSYFKLHKLY